MTFVGLLALTAIAFLVHGYHFGLEDQATYVPAIKIALDPTLYPHDAEFFVTQSGPTIFPHLLSATVRRTHLSLEAAMLLWQVVSVFAVLLATFTVARKCFPSTSAQWAAVTMIASLLTLPVTCVALFIVDPYLHPRALATAALLFMLGEILDRRFWIALLWLLVAAALHIQMAFYGALLGIFFAWPSRRQSTNAPSPSLAALLLALPFASLFQPASPAWHEAARTHWYLYLARWPWFCWIGIFAPIAAFYGLRVLARRRDLSLLAHLSSRLLLFAIFIFFIGLVATVPVFERLVPYQPLRGLHLVYVFLLIFAGGALGEFVLRRKPLLWIAIFLPLCAVMSYVQRQLTPNVPHVEWPGVAPKNPWLAAFAWVKSNTPKNAYFVLDPNYLDAAGEDQYGFRALAERSMMVDYQKDSGVALLFPVLATRWQREFHARDGWKNFQLSDFRRLHDQFGVDWTIVEKSQLAAARLHCPYENDAVRVCQIP